MENNKWWEDDISEVLTIVVLGVIAALALIILRVASKEIVSTIGGGLIGYLVHGYKNLKQTVEEKQWKELQKK